MKYAVIENIPINPKELYEYALSKSYNYWIDEKGTVKNPDIWRRHDSDLSFEEAFNIIQDNSPHWVISFRNNSYLSTKEKDFWEFGGCNISSGLYGEVFIWIQVEVNIALDIFKKFKLEINNY